MRFGKTFSPRSERDNSRSYSSNSSVTNDLESSGRTRQVWDDYGTPKVTNKKKEYDLDSRNRMLPIPKAKRARLRPQETTESSELSREIEIVPVRTDYEVLEERLGVKFQDNSWLARALTHRSGLSFNERSDYERLEFLGDAVLDLAVAHLLSDAHPLAKEGELSKMRAALVNTQSLAEVARRLEIGPFIKMGRGEQQSGGADRSSILADVMEATIGAVYRDNSYEQAYKLVERLLGEQLTQVTPFDPKTDLQEALHLAGSEPPEYMLELVEGPEHAPTFVCVVLVDGVVAGRGRGPTKKAAQQAAAAYALSKLSADVPALPLKEAQRVIIAEALLQSEKSGTSRALSHIGEQVVSELSSKEAVGERYR